MFYRPSLVQEPVAVNSALCLHIEYYSFKIADISFNFNLLNNRNVVRVGVHSLLQTHPLLNRED